MIIATGGAGRVFRENTNGGIVTGDGMALAYRHGVPLRDMEFMQYHPTCMPVTGLLFTEACRGEGGFLLNKDGYRYLQDYGLGPAEDKPRNKFMELGPRDRLSQAFWHEKQKGRTLSDPRWGSYVHLDLRHLGEKMLRERLPQIYELAVEYLGVDPAKQCIPVLPAVHYTMGGIAADGATAAPLAGPVLRRRVLQRRHPRRQPARLEFADGTAGIRQGGRRRGGGIRQEHAARQHRQDHEARAGRAGPCCRHRHAHGRHGAPGHHPQRDGQEHGGRLRHLPHAETMQATCDKLAELKQRYKNIQLDDNSKGWNTEWLLAIELGYLLDVAQAMAHSALNRTRVARLAPAARRLRAARRRQLPEALAGATTGRGRCAAHRLRPGEDHQLAAGHARLRRRRRGSRPQGQGGRPCLTPRRIEIQVLRYRPEEEDKPVWQSYYVPFTNDMSVLQGLQYIKDELDGSLTFRWSCRMAICGSCGMMINGKPMLSCSDLPARPAARPGAGRGAGAFPDRARPGRGVGEFVKKLEGIKPYIIPKEPRKLSQGEYLQTPAAAGAVRAVQLVHQLHAVLRGLPAVRAQPGLHRPGRAGAAAPLQRGLARRRPRRAHEDREHGRGRLGLHRGGLLLRGVPQARRSRPTR